MHQRACPRYSRHSQWIFSGSFFKLKCEQRHSFEINTIVILIQTRITGSECVILKGGSTVLHAGSIVLHVSPTSTSAPFRHPLAQQMIRACLTVQIRHGEHTF